MKTPKMLPWLARKAGISDARAAALWAEAIRHATTQTGWVGTPEYLRVANQRWKELVDVEAAAERAAVNPLVSAQTKLAMLPLIVWQGYSLIVGSAWRQLFRCGASELPRRLA